VRHSEADLAQLGLSCEHLGGGAAAISWPKFSTTAREHRPEMVSMSCSTMTMVTASKYQ